MSKHYYGGQAVIEGVMMRGRKTMAIAVRNPQDAVKPKDRIKKITARGNRMYKRKEIDRKEALSKVTYQNAIEMFSSRGIKGSNDAEKIESYAVALQDALKYLQP